MRAKDKEGKKKEEEEKRGALLNCTPFVRQYGILTRNQGKAKGLATCYSQATSPFGCLNIFSNNNV